ncbi:hypothetical protein PAJ34TS1_11050 [Paenibacillus azoreducens]|uniref:Uncharacterized protein n=1 Tax=Paenibacillus azoreducens TaxID=116718 RepID=A0A919YDH7_9BACL|nr:hypothetical protein [Paenibacillus azoreducens]GIO46800.1 hypothetical protein J34TS1_15650 [Paenibacillus azoreducens]
MNITCMAETATDINNQRAEKSRQITVSQVSIVREFFFKYRSSNKKTGTSKMAVAKADQPTTVSDPPKPLM